MPTVFVPIIIVGTAALVIIGIVFRGALAPKKIANLQSYVKQGKHAAAIRTAKQLLQKEPRSTELHFLLGVAYLRDNKKELALMELKTVNEIGQFGGYAPEVAFRKTIADLYVEFDQPEEALKEYLLLIKLEPHSAEHVFRAGTLFEKRDNAERAAGFFRKAIELDPKHSDAHFRLGLQLYRGKHPSEAKVELEQAINGPSVNYQAFYYLGRILKEKHDFVAALIAFEKAQRDQEIKIKALVERGSCYMSLNSLEKAVTELERAIRLIENESSNEALYARYFLSACFEKMRKFESAIEQWEKIYAKKPAFRDVAEKLTQYQDLRTDDHMKDFLTAPPGEFAENCKSLAEAMGLVPRDVSEIQNGCEIIAVDAESKFRNTRKMPTLIRILRISETIDISTIRALHEDMKKMNVLRGALVTTGRFTRTAVEFAETRPINLIDKEQLQKLLQSQPANQNA